MPDNQALNIKNRLAKIYLGGIVAFCGIFGTLTLLALFLARLK